MKKTFRSVLVLLFTFCILISSASLASAAGVGKVSKLTASKRTATAITLTWSKVSKAKGYTLYRYDTSSKKWAKIKTTSATSYTNSSLENSTAYSYRVRAYIKEKGKTLYGAYSPTLKTSTAPAKVSSFTASTIYDDSVTVKWNRVSGAKGYRIYSYDFANKKYVKVADTTRTSMTVSNLTPGEDYRFAVKAYHKLTGTTFGAYSAALNVTTKPSAVKGLKATTVNSDSYTLTWNMASGADGYQIVKYNETNRKWENVTHVSSLSYTFSDVTGSDRYRVRAYVKVGTKYVYGSYSSAVTANVAVSAPATPLNLNAALNSNSGISLTWTKVNGATGYEVQEYDPQHGDWVLLATTTTNSYSLKNLKDTREYKFRIRAYIVSGTVKVYGNYCESVSIFFKSSEKPDSIYSEEMEKSGIFGYLYDPEENCFYTASDPWQRVAGFNSIYDFCAPFTLINYDTERIRFEYGNKDWMIQLWKGQYGLVFYGAEVGVYTKPKDRELMHYDCASDDEMLKMSITMLQKKTVFGKEIWQEKFSRPYGSYWWCTGFVPGNILGRFDNLRIKTRITMKDYTMLDGFTKALENAKIEYTVTGLDVNFTYI